MKPYDDEAEAALQEWTEKEVRAAIGVSPACTSHDEGYEPRGPHRWFPEALAELASILTMRWMSETWNVRIAMMLATAKEPHQDGRPEHQEPRPPSCRQPRDPAFL